MDFDVAFRLQSSSPIHEVSGSRGNQTVELGRAGTVTGLAKLLTEAFADPSEELVDGFSALQLHQLEPFLKNFEVIGDTFKLCSRMEIE